MNKLIALIKLDHDEKSEIEFVESVVRQGIVSEGHALDSIVKIHNRYAQKWHEILNHENDMKAMVAREVL